MVRVPGKSCSVCGHPELLEKYLPNTEINSLGIAGYFCSEECKSKSLAATYLISGSAFFVISSLLSILVQNIFFTIVAFVLPTILLIKGIRGYNVKITRWYENQLNSSKQRNETKVEGIPDGVPRTIYVKALGAEFNNCCYQTARIGEIYCICGRAVSKDLIQIFG